MDKAKLILVQHLFWNTPLQKEERERRGKKSEEKKEAVWEKQGAAETQQQMGWQYIVKVTELSRWFLFFCHLLF